jgi:hypothetical protein
MFKIVGTLPVKTRLPSVAWALAGLVTLFSIANSLVKFVGACQQLNCRGSEADHRSLRLHD